MVEVTVIIPTFGNPDMLENAIKSVLNQTLEELELIIVDDNNQNSIEREQTKKIVDKYLKTDDRVKYICHEKNINGAAARNTGIKFSVGKYIAFLDSDDEFLSNRLEKCVNVLKKSSDKKIAGVYTGCEFKRDGKTYKRYKKVSSGNYLVDTLACTFKFCTGSNIFMKSRVIKELHGFDETFLRHQDYEFLVRYFEQYSLAAIPEVLVIKNNQNRNLPNTKKMIEIKQQYIYKYRNIINQLSYNDRKKIYDSHNLAIAESFLLEKNRKQAKEYYQKVSIKQRLKIKTIVRRFVFILKIMID